MNIFSKYNSTKSTLPKQYNVPEKKIFNNFNYDDNITSNFDVKVSRAGEKKCRIHIKKQNKQINFSDRLSVSSVGKSDQAVEFLIKTTAPEGRATDVEKFPHNIVCWFLSGKLDSDKSLFSIFDKNKLYNDNSQQSFNENLDPEVARQLSSGKGLTPDMIDIDVDNEIINVLEVSTSNNVDAAYETKKIKYERFIKCALPLLKDKYLNYKLVLYVCCVNSTRMVTNLNLDETRDNIFISMGICHYLLGLQAMNLAFALFPESKTELKVLEKRLDSLLSKVNEFKYINERLVNKHCDISYTEKGKWFRQNFGHRPDIEVENKMISEMPFVTDEYRDWCKNTPVDENYISKVIYDLWLKSNPKNYKPSIAIEDWLNELKKSTRMDDKSPIQLPMICSKFNDDELTLPILPFAEDSIFRIWGLIIQHCNYKLFRSTPEDEFTQKMFTKKSGFESRVKTKRFRMIDYSSNPELIELFFAERIGLKRRMREGVLDAQKEKHKEGFSWNVLTDDIEDYMKIGISLDLKPTKRDMNITTKRLNNLFAAREIKGDLDPHSEKVHDVFLRFENTLLGRKLSNLGKILEECNFQFNYPIGTNKMFVTKIEEEDLYLMVKPNGPSNILNFSTLTRAEHCSEKPFKQMMEFNGFKASNFVSLNKDRLGQLLYPLEKAFGLFMMWCEIFDQDPTKVLSSPEDFPQILNHFSMALMIFLEAKAQTSENLLQIRYAYMKVASESPLNHPFEICSKFSRIIRSRLLIYLLKNFVTYFSVMLDRKPFMITTYEYDKIPKNNKESIDQISDRLIKELEKIDKEKKAPIGKQASKQLHKKPKNLEKRK